MYLKFFGLQRLPFRLRPDREFLHLDAAYAALREALVQALGREGSIIVLTGQAGVGKTVLLESALDELRESRIALRISQPQMSPDELVRAIGEQLRAAVRAAENGRGTERLPADQPADDLQHSVGALSALGRRPGTDRASRQL
jgi:type II secretory pathway predicted ATPase ExeA